MDGFASRQRGFLRVYLDGGPFAFGYHPFIRLPAPSPSRGEGKILQRFAYPAAFAIKADDANICLLPLREKVPAGG